jgi:hypothetical protein
LRWTGEDRGVLEGTLVCQPTITRGDAYLAMLLAAFRSSTVRGRLVSRSRATSGHDATGRTVNTTDQNNSFDGDTSREALRAQFAALRRIPPARRLELMDDLTQLVRTMTWEGLRRRNPGLGEAELDRLFFELVLGPDLAAKVLEHRRARLARQAP